MATRFWPIGPTSHKAQEIDPLDELHREKPVRAVHVPLDLVELGVIEAVVHEPLEQISVRTVFHFHSSPPGPWGTGGAGRASDAGS
jgi:hypothetical protein